MKNGKRSPSGDRHLSLERMQRLGVDLGPI
jgi:hypothetical protein